MVSYIIHKYIYGERETGREEEKDLRVITPFLQIINYFSFFNTIFTFNKILLWFSLPKIVLFNLRIYHFQTLIITVFLHVRYGKWGPQKK